MDGRDCAVLILLLAFFVYVCILDGGEDALSVMMNLNGWMMVCGLGDWVSCFLFGCQGLPVTSFGC